MKKAWVRFQHVSTERKAFQVGFWGVIRLTLLVLVIA
jgi:hypothetical protein